jgi:predicted nucleic acid-binding protein
VKDRVFIDTNVLVYADDLDAGAKTPRARAILGELFREQNGVISTQVLQEFFVVTTRKLGVEAAVARRKVELLATLEVVSVQVPHILQAVDLHRLHSVSFWDALILACAAAAGCTRLWSEDLQDGATIAGVTIENPFAAR